MLFSRFRLATSLSFYGQLIRSILKLHFLNSRLVPKLENHLATVIQATSPVAVPQARVGFYLYLKEVISPGDEILISSYTLIDMVNMVLCAGGVPVFVDTIPSSCVMDPEDVLSKITPKSRMIVATHLYGMPTDLDAIKQICEEHDLLLFEDCAQAFGVQTQGQMVGTFGDAGVYSFGALKNINGLFGGALVVRDTAVREKLRARLNSFKLFQATRLLSKSVFCIWYDIATHPLVYSPLQKPIRYLFDRAGHIDKEAVRRKSIPASYLTRMTSLQAALVLHGLRDWKSKATASQCIASLYTSCAETTPAFTPITAGVTPGGFTTYLQFPIWVHAGNLPLKAHLSSQRIDINVDFFRDVSSLDCFKEFYRPCPNTQEILTHLALLPSHPRQSRSYTERVTRTLLSYSPPPLQLQK